MVSLKIFRQSKLEILVFVFRTRLIGILILAGIFGLFIASSAIGVSKAYPTQQELNLLAFSLSGNLGFRVLLGVPHSLNSVAGFTVWRSMGVLPILGSIWTIIATTKTFRGDEDDGRWEVFLSGQTTKRKATLNALLALEGVTLVAFTVIVLIVSIVGRIDTISFSFESSMYFALASIICIVMFIPFVCLLSQVFPEKKQVLQYSSLFLGVCFFIRAIGDSAPNIPWLSNISPLGWVEKLQPVTAPNPKWFIPILSFTIMCSILSIYLSGIRDLGEGFVRDNNFANPRFYLLGSASQFSIRQSLVSMFIWITSLSLGAFFMGSISKTASDIFESSKSATNVFKSIASISTNNSINTFLSIVFLMLIIAVMVMVVGFVSNIREEEANGYLDNILVQPVPRMLWLVKRSTLISCTVIIISLTVCIVCYIGAKMQGTDADFLTFVKAGINIIPGAIFIMGTGVLTFGIIPRYTTIVMYTVIAWSFLLYLIGPLLKWGPDILNTSLFYHIALVPAVSFDLKSSLIIAGIGILACILGIVMFNKRDITGE